MSPTESSVGPELTMILDWAGPVIQQFFTLALASDGLAMFQSGEAPRSGLGFFSTCSCCLTWCCYGLAQQNPSIYLPNAAGFIVGTITTLLFISLTEQRMGSTLLAMGAMASAVLTLMFGDVMPADEATQWTANIGILQAVVMLGSGCAVWPTVGGYVLQVLREKDASCLSLPLTVAGAAQGASYAALGYLVLHDTNIWAPNLAGLTANIICLALIGLYGSPNAKSGKQLRD